MSAFEDFVQVELPKRGYLDKDPAQETIIIRRGAGPRQFDAITLGEGQVLALSNGQLTGITLTGNRKAVLEVTEASTTWVLNHNLGSEDVIVQAFDENNSVIFPDAITVNDENTITIQFNSFQRGFARVLFLDDFAISGVSTGSGSSASAALPYIHVQDLRAVGVSGQSFTLASAPTGPVDVRQELQTVVGNTIEGAALTNNAVTLPQGTYRVSVASGALVPASTGMRVFDSTSGKALAYSVSAKSNGSPATGAPTYHARGEFTVPAGGAVVGIDFKYTVAGSPTYPYTTTLHAPTNGGYVELYADMLIEKLA